MISCCHEGLYQVTFTLCSVLGPVLNILPELRNIPQPQNMFTVSLSLQMRRLRFREVWCFPRVFQLIRGMARTWAQIDPSALGAQCPAASLSFTAFVPRHFVYPLPDQTLMSFLYLFLCLIKIPFKSFKWEFSYLPDWIKSISSLF